MKNLRVALLSLTLTGAPLAARAEAPPPPQGAPSARDLERMEAHHRTERVVELADALELSEAEALRMAAAMRPFDERRRAVMTQLHADHETVERIARGEGEASAKELEAALARLAEAHGKMAAIDQEMLETLARGMSVKQKARLALVLNRPGPGMGHRPPPGMGPERGAPPAP